LIVCATTARTPLFDGNLVRDDSLTVAVGAYEPDARELDSELIGRAQLVVDDTSTALREAGDVIIPIAEGVIEAASLIPMRDIITGATLVDHQRPRVFKSTGMSWEDLVVASEVFRAS
jgi:ornithine cyclodeaminase